jgi:hypothetical protein
MKAYTRCGYDGCVMGARLKRCRGPSGSSPTYVDGYYSCLAECGVNVLLSLQCSVAFIAIFVGRLRSCTMK